MGRSPGNIGTLGTQPLHLQLGNPGFPVFPMHAVSVTPRIATQPVRSVSLTRDAPTASRTLPNKTIAGIEKQLSPAAERITRDLPNLSKLSGSGLRSTGERHIQLLLGHRTSSLEDLSVDASRVSANSSSRDAGRPSHPLGFAQLDSLPSLARKAAVPQPAPELPSKDQQKRSILWMYVGSTVFKFGLDTIFISIPVIALTTLGGALHVGLLAVVFGLSQTVFSSAFNSLVSRFQANRVLAGAVAVNGLLVTAIIGLNYAGLFTPWLLFPIYGIIGGALAVIQTSRNVIPPLILGQDEAALKRYNSRIYIVYEIAGIAGAALAGILIGMYGPMTALLLSPPTTLIAVFALWRVVHAKNLAATAPAGRSPEARQSIQEWFHRYINDLRQARDLVFKDKRTRWIALAMILPYITHRTLENLLIPVYANSVLGNKSLGAYLLTASNTGELLGAAMILKASGKSFDKSYFWVRGIAMGLLALWALPLSSSLLIVMPLILACSMTRAANDTSIVTDIQSNVPKNDQSKLFGFIYGTSIILVTLASPAIGYLLDHVALKTGFVLLSGVYTLFSAALFFASRRLKTEKN